MAEFDITEATASFHQEADHNEEHDNRDVPVSYADPSRECDNIYYENNMTKEEIHLWLDFLKKLPISVNRQKKR